MAHFIEALKNCGFIVGCMNYVDHYPGEAKSPKIVLSVQVERFASFSAIMDTGAPWCIFDPELTSLLEIDKESGYRPEEGLNIRLTLNKWNAILRTLSDSPNSLDKIMGCFIIRDASSARQEFHVNDNIYTE